MKKLLIIFFTGIMLLLFNMNSVYSQNNNKENEPEMIPLNFNGVDLQMVINFVTEKTKKQILYDDKLIKGKKVYFISSREGIPKEALFAVFQSILEMHGLVLIKVSVHDEEIYKLAQATSAPSKAVEVYESNKINLPNDERFVSQVVYLKYISPTAAKQSLQFMVQNARSLVPLDDAKALIITDTALNVKRILKIIKLLDVKLPDYEFRVVELKHANPVDLEQKIRTIVQTMSIAQTPKGGNVKEQIQIISDTRLNALIMLALPDRLNQIEDLITQLDKEVPVEPRSLHVYKLKHAKAEELASILNQIYTGTNSPTTSRRTTPPRPKQPYPSGNYANSDELVPNIIADKQNNSLLIVANQERYEELQDIIKQMDKRRAQVSLRALVVEVTGTKSVDLGFDLTSIGSPNGNNPRGFAATNFGVATLTDIDGDGIPDLRVPVQDGVVAGIYKGSFEKIPVILKTKVTNNTLNVLSLPEVTTNDNSEALLEAAEEQPVAETTYPSTTANSLITTNVRYEKAGITLAITPHISQNDYLQLDIEQTIEQFVGSGNVNNLPPPKISRKVKASVTVPNNKTVVIGGLTRDVTRETEQGIPLLKDIPWIGNIFQSQGKVTDKTTLYVFITPTILVDEDFKDFINYTEQYQKKIFDESGRWPGKRVKKEPDALDIFNYKEPFGNE